MVSDLKGVRRAGAAAKDGRDIWGSRCAGYGFLFRTSQTLLMVGSYGRISKSLSQTKATPEILKPLDLDSTEKVAYMGALTVPGNAGFWQNCRHAFPLGAVDEASEQYMMLSLICGRKGWH